MFEEFLEGLLGEEADVFGEEGEEGEEETLEEGGDDGGDDGGVMGSFSKEMARSERVLATSRVTFAACLEGARL